MCFFGFLQVGEAVVPSDSGFDATVHLAYGAVRVDNWVQPSYVEVYLKASKMDPFRHGVSVYLGWTDRVLCPVATILDYMVRQGSAPGPFLHLLRWLLLHPGEIIVSSESCIGGSRYLGVPLHWS